MFAKYTYKRHFNTYQIFLPDVDGLINGSPVRLMGIQIGYVNQINIVGEDVYVKFIVTAPKTRIPRGSTATVEFSGLGGSKSLEIYPPSLKNSHSDKLLIAQSPKRIHDSLGLLSDMFDQITAIAYNISHFMDEVGIIDSKNDKSLANDKSSKSAEEFLEFSDNWIDKAQKQCDKLGDKLNKIKDKKTNKEGDKINK